MSKIGKGCHQPVKGTVELGQETIAAILAGNTPVGIELGAVKVGCVKDTDGITTGAVFLCIEKDEETGVQTEVAKAINYADSVITNPYTGEISSCDDESRLEFISQCYTQPETNTVINGDQTAPWVLVAGDLELTRAGGNQAGDGGFQNGTLGVIEYSRDGINFGTFQNIMGGGQNNINTPIFLRNATTGTIVEINLTLFAGNGSPNYTGSATINTPEELFKYVIYDDGSSQAFNCYNQPVDFDNSWVISKCVNEVRVINTEPIQVVNANEEQNKRCFSRRNRFIDTLETIDTGGFNLVNTVEITPDDDGVADELVVRIDNVGVTQGNIAFALDGVALVITDNTNMFVGNPDLTQIVGGRTNYTLALPAGLTFIGGQTYALTATVTGAPTTEVFWSQGTANDNNQVAFNPANGTNFPDITLLQEGNETFCEITYGNGDVVLFDQFNNIITAIPDNADLVLCDDGLIRIDPACKEELAERISDALIQDKVIGTVCYQEVAFIPAGNSIPLDASTGTLPDGTTWNFSVDASDTIIHSTTTAGDTRTDSNVLTQLDFSNGVEVTLSPTNGGDVLNPIVWQNQASGNSRLISPSGEPVVYNPGAVDAALDVTTDPQRAESTLPNNQAPDAGDDWGTIVAGNTQQVFWQGRDAEAVNFSVRLITQEFIGDKKTAFGCRLKDGTIVYRNIITGEIVDINASNMVVCADDLPNSYVPVQLEELCAQVDGTAQPVVPVTWFNVNTKEYSETVYLNELGMVITGAVTAADSPCDCGCIDCPDEEDPTFLSDPDFLLVDNGNINIPVDNTIPFNLEYQNNSANGYDNVVVEITDFGDLVINPNPENIGTIGAANAGFTNMTINAPTAGTYTVTATITGTLGGTSDVYGHSITFDIVAA